MAGYIQVPADSTGKRVDTVTLTDATVEVHRQKIVMTGASGTAEVCVVTNAAPAAGDMGLVVRQAGTVDVAMASGTFNISTMPAVVIAAGAANIGSVNNISATVTVAGSVNISTMPAVVLAAGTANFGNLNHISRTVQVAVGTPFTVNNISATVVTSGLVGLTAGTAVIGDINAISRTVQVAIGTPFTLQGISTTVQVAIGTPFTVNNISAAIVLAAGANNIGSINNISATVVTGLSYVIEKTSNSQVQVGDSANAAIRVNVVAGSAGGPSMTDNTTYSTGASLVAPAGFIFFSASATAVTDGRIAAGRITDARGQHVNLRNNAGTEIGTATTPLHVLQSATASVILAAGTANIGSVNNISATVTVVGVVNISATHSVILAAGTANIGTLNNISATVVTGLSYVIEKTSNSQVQVGDSANAAIRVNVVAGSSGGVSQVDGTTFSTQAANFVPMGGIFDDATPDTLSENDAGVVRMTTNRAFHINHRTDGGVAMEDSANSALRVNVVAGAAGGVSQVDGTTFSTQAANFVPIGGIFDDATSNALSENDAGVVRLTTNRAFHVNFRDTTGAELGAASATGLFIRTATIALAADQILGSISRTVQVAIGTPFTVNNISATVVVSGTVSLGASTANIGTVNNISATLSTVLAAGTANIGTLNNISATLSTVLAAGTANIGSINNISATVNVAIATPFIIQGISTTVQVAIGTPFTVNNISAAVVLAAGAANIGSINNISATVTVAGNVNISATASVILAAGTANFGTLNDISRTVQVAISTPFTLNNISATVTVAGIVTIGTVALMSASHGPKCVTASTSAVVTLVAAPGAGVSVYITQLAVTNAGTVGGLARIGTSASASTILMFCASAGGGFVMNFDPPWKLSASEAALCSVKPNTSGNTYFNVNFYVGA